MDAIVRLYLFSPRFPLHFGFLGGFGAATAQRGTLDHPIWVNAAAGAIASGLMGGLLPEWTPQGLVPRRSAAQVSALH